jgi:hypothetical protein
MLFIRAHAAFFVFGLLLLPSPVGAAEADRGPALEATAPSFSDEGAPPADDSAPTPDAGAADAALDSTPDEPPTSPEPDPDGAPAGTPAPVVIDQEQIRRETTAPEPVKDVSGEIEKVDDESQALPFDRVRAQTPAGTVRPVHDAPPADDADEKKKRSTERQDFSFNALRLSASGGYALRLSADERSHGGAGTLTVGLPVFWGFGVAGEALVFGWGPSEQRQAPLGFAGGAGLLTYVFDDSASTALIGVGPLVGYALELEEDGSLTTGLHAGAMFSFGLRFAVAPTVAAEIGIRAPFILYGPEGFVARIPLTQSPSTTPGLFESQFVLTLGLTFDPFLFFDLFSKGADPLPLVVPFMATASATTP